MIIIHDIPDEIAYHRNHPTKMPFMYQAGAAYSHCMSSGLFLWIWATLYNEETGWGIKSNNHRIPNSEDEISELKKTISSLTSSDKGDH
nr:MULTISPECIES: DUF3302 domain-containing protein [unclassified Oleiphilus]